MALNLKKAKDNSKSDGNFKPLAEGRYDFAVEAGETGEFKTGTPKIEFTFRCDSDDYKNRKVWHSFALTENAQIFLIRFLEALGLNELTEQENVSERQIINATIGKKVSAFVEIVTGNNGKPYNNLKNFAAVDGGGSSSPAPAANLGVPASNPVSKPANKKLFS